MQYCIKQQLKSEIHQRGLNRQNIPSWIPVITEEAILKKNNYIPIHHHVMLKLFKEKRVALHVPLTYYIFVWKLFENGCLVLN